MNFRKVLLLLMLPLSAYADSYSALNTVRGVTVGDGLVRVKLASNTGGTYESCATKQVYAFDPGAPGGASMLSTLLSAKMSGSTIQLQSIGCHGEYSKITHLYFCDTNLCN